MIRKRRWRMIRKEEEMEDDKRMIRKEEEMEDDKEGRGDGG